MSKKQLAFFLLLLCSCQLALGQETEKEKKTKDSLRGYKKIEQYSKKRGFTKFLHGLIFEPIRVKKKAQKAKPKNVPKKNYSAFEGKIVRKINVETLDPFGYSEKNTTDVPTKKLSKIGNSMHVKSKQLTIRNLLLLKRNKPLDSLLLKESERLVRSQRYVRGVVITPELIENNPDSVDINIRVLDSWSLIPDASGSPSRANFELRERNFLGLGHEFVNNYQSEFSSGRSAYSTRYTVPNIMNTYIRTDLIYRINLERDYSKSINIERPFYSPFARWGAGAYFDQQFRSDTLPDASGVFGRQYFKYNSQDVWGGHSYQIFRGDSESDRTTNFISAGRILNIDYTESPTAVYDSIDFYSDERFYLAGIGIASRQYVQDKYIFNYGIIEDVPVGRAFAITGGWQDKNNIGRFYLGGRASFGRFYKFGYLSTNFEYGTFFYNSGTEQSAFSMQANYFTNLLEAGRWKLRQFIKSRLVLGVNRKESWGDAITINEGYGIPGFDPAMLYGTKKLVLTFQTQAYSPWNLGGFRLNPYMSYTMAVLGTEKIGLTSSKLYHQIGLGLIISNDYLVFSQFQLSVAYYPTIPGGGDHLFKTNAFNTEDFGFQNFEISKPRTVEYQ